MKNSTIRAWKTLSLLPSPTEIETKFNTFATIDTRLCPSTSQQLKLNSVQKKRGTEFRSQNYVRYSKWLEFGFVSESNTFVSNYWAICQKKPISVSDCINSRITLLWLSDVVDPFYFFIRIDTDFAAKFLSIQHQKVEFENCGWWTFHLFDLKHSKIVHMQCYPVKQEQNNDHRIPFNFIHAYIDFTIFFIINHTLLNIVWI